MGRRDVKEVLEIFSAALDERYLTHYEIQWGIAEDERTVSKNAARILKRYIQWLFMSKPLMKPGLFVAELDGKVVGFSICWVERRRRKKVGEFMDLAVHPGYRRRGIGTRLTEKTHAYLLSKGATEVYAAVNPNNSESASLLNRMGYRCVSHVYRKGLK